MFAGVSLLKPGKRSGGCERKEIPKNRTQRVLRPEPFCVAPGGGSSLPDFLALLEERLHAALDADRKSVV